MLLSLFGFNIGVKIFFKTEKDRMLLQQLESKNMEQQLEYLKYQISPHFFMNTLNNIHALIDINPEKAKDTLVELSKMMRYLRQTSLSCPCNARISSYTAISN